MWDLSADGCAEIFYHVWSHWQTGWTHLDRSPISHEDEFCVAMTWFWSVMVVNVTNFFINMYLLSTVWPPGTPVVPSQYRVQWHNGTFVICPNMGLHLLPRIVTTITSTLIFSHLVFDSKSRPRHNIFSAGGHYLLLAPAMFKNPELSITFSYAEIWCHVDQHCFSQPLRVRRGIVTSEARSYGIGENRQLGCWGIQRPTWFYFRGPINWVIYISSQMTPLESGLWTHCGAMAIRMLFRGYRSTLPKIASGRQIRKSRLSCWLFMVVSVLKHSEIHPVIFIINIHMIQLFFNIIHLIYNKLWHMSHFKTSLGINLGSLLILFLCLPHVFA